MGKKLCHRSLYGEPQPERSISLLAAYASSNASCFKASFFISRYEGQIYETVLAGASNSAFWPLLKPRW